MNNINKKTINIEVCEEEEYNVTHESSTVTMKSRQWWRDLECKLNKISFAQTIYCVDVLNHISFGQPIYCVDV
jgi:hypothetical protein